MCSFGKFLVSNMLDFLQCQLAGSNMCQGCGHELKSESEQEWGGVEEGRRKKEEGRRKKEEEGGGG